MPLFDAIGKVFEEAGKATVSMSKTVGNTMTSAVDNIVIKPAKVVGKTSYSVVDNVILKPTTSIYNSAMGNSDK
ncbi:hypothetical protein ACKWTF_008666 [Chironomus riparius]